MAEKQMYVEEEPTGIPPIVEPPSGYGIAPPHLVDGQTQFTPIQGPHDASWQNDNPVAQNPPPACQYTQQLPISPNPPIVLVAQNQQCIQPVHVPDEMACSVFTTLCCFLYLGIPAMIFASQANRLRNVDPERALAKARVARTLNITSIFLGIVVIIVLVVLQVLARQRY